MRKSVFWTLLMIAGLAIGCGPSYKTFTYYTPPPDPSGKECVQSCFQEKTDCEHICREENRRCEADARIYGEEQYRRARLDYKESLLDWRLERQRCREMHPPGGCSHLESTRPEEPELDDYIDDYHCRDGCEHCIQNYDACFELCGGAIRRETHCVSGCD
jgi:hypothetical protein